MGAEAPPRKSSPSKLDKRASRARVAERLRSIDLIYSQLKRQLLSEQHYASGLFPKFGGGGDKSAGYARDSIYAATACWALAQAYQKQDDDRGRQHELGQSAVKTMRGILTGWMHQTNTLETFKNQSGPDNALHSKFDLKTRQPILTTDEYSHLQMDIVALYLLTLAQMTSSGLQILLTETEVCVVQNLVFYIERAYRTPDFGMWERGTRYNDGTAEIHASTLGMVKAALEAVSGVRVFGAPDAPAAATGTLYVDIDAHNRNRTTLETLLPRESHSRNTDAALIPTLLFPAFASHQDRVRSNALDKVMRKLGGTSGVKRFLRDGYRHRLEDPERRFFAPEETASFRDSECEWPLFFLYLTISCALLGQKDEATEHWERLLNLCMVDDGGGLVVPECYARDEEGELDPTGDPSSIFVWGQSLYFIAWLLQEGLVEAADIDPLGRHMPASQRPRQSNQSFQGSGNRAPVVQVGILAENAVVKSTLAMFGVMSQTPHEVAPLQIWPTSRLVRTLGTLGACPGLGLTGRPLRPIGSLGTSKVYRVFGEKIMCVPILFDVEDFYLSADPNVLIDDIKRELGFVATRWKLSGRPTVITLVREHNLAGDSRPLFLRLLADIKSGSVDGVRVKTARLQRLLIAATVEHLDFLTEEPPDLPRALSSADENLLKKDRSKSTTGLDEIDLDVCSLETDTNFTMKDHTPLGSEDLLDVLLSSGPTRVRSRALMLEELVKRHGLDHRVAGASLRERLETVHSEALGGRSWAVVRFTAALLGKVVASLAPALTAVLVRGNRVALGLPPDQPETLIAKPVAPWIITSAIYDGIPREEVSVGVLTQELLIGVDSLLASEGNLLREVLTLHMSGLIAALTMLHRYRNPDVDKSGSAPLTGVEKNVPPSTRAADSIFALSPTQIKTLLWDVLTQRGWVRLSAAQQRRLNGALNRIPQSAYDRLWFILQKSPAGIVFAGEKLEQEPMLTNMTRYELTFNLAVEELLCRIRDPELRQLYVELIGVLALLLERHPELAFRVPVDLEALMRAAAAELRTEQGLGPSEDLSPLYDLAKSGAQGPTAAAYFAKAIADALPLDACAVS